MTFERYKVRGMMGAMAILRRIVIEKSPIVGWAENIILQNIGHRSGKHSEFMRSPEHLEYYKEVGREIPDA